MKFLIFGDVYGSMGRCALEMALPDLRSSYAPDFILVNSENLTHGRGASSLHLEKLQSIGVTVCTGGNHIFSRYDESKRFFEGESPFQLRPANHIDSPFFTHPGKGYSLYEVGGVRVLVINLMSSIFMKDQLHNPFIVADEILTSLAGRYDIVIVDFHRETTAELVCLAHWLKDRVTCVYGTHTHVQTSDERIVDGMALLTDVGMTGVMHSAIGQEFEARILGFLSGSGVHGIRPTPSTSRECVVCALFVETDAISHRAIRIERIRENIVLPE